MKDLKSLMKDAKQEKIYELTRDLKFLDDTL